MGLKKIMGAAMIVACFGLASAANAASIHWNLVDIAFDDGGTAGGTFETDSATGFLLSYDITTTAGSILGGYHYYDEGIGQFGTSYNSNPSGFLMSNLAAEFFLQFEFSNPLMSYGVNMLQVAHEDKEWYHYPGRSTDVGVGYAVSVAPVPEPETYAMMLAGLGLLGFVARRRKGQAVAV